MSDKEETIETQKKNEIKEDKDDDKYVDDEYDLASAAVHAAKHAGTSEDADIYSRVLYTLGKTKKSMCRDLDIDEQEAADLHQKLFPLVPPPSPPRIEVTSSKMGTAAALQALKMITGIHSTGSSNAYICPSPITPKGSSNNMNALVGIAMAEASRLFDIQKELDLLADDANKEKAIQEAGGLALRMYLKSHGGNSGGLVALAMKFL